MFKEDSYIKSIEKYFLTHLGKGIMLSYSDYELIASWKDKNIRYLHLIEAIILILLGILMITGILS